MENKKQNEEQSSDLKMELLKLKERVEQALALLAKGNVDEAQDLLEKIGIPRLGAGPRQITKSTKVPEGSRVIEGVFDGQHMVGADGRQYLVPQNYASKSKLVEGDILKLAITPEGAFVYKQIGPIARKRLSATLNIDEHGFWCASDGMHSWRLLTAAVSFFKGKAGDEVIILLPSGAPSKWAAVENIISK